MSGGSAATSIARNADRRDQQREARIRTGMTDIENVFKGFDAPFFNNIRQAQVDALLPQLNDQYKSETEKLTYAFARGGQLNSSARTRAASELEGQRRLALSDIDSRAENAVKSARVDVEDERAQLISILQATADPEGAANQARNRSEFLNIRPADTNLGIVLQNATAGLGQLNQPRYDTYGQRTNRPLSFGSGTRSRTVK